MKVLHENEIFVSKTQKANSVSPKIDKTTSKSKNIDLNFQIKSETIKAAEEMK